MQEGHSRTLNRFAAELEEMVMGRVGWEKFLRKVCFSYFILEVIRLDKLLAHKALLTFLKLIWVETGCLLFSHRLKATVCMLDMDSFYEYSIPSAYLWKHTTRSPINTMIYIKWCCSVAKSCLSLCNPVDCSTPGSLVLHYLPQKFCSNLCLLSRWCYLTMSSSATAAFCLQSSPASESFLRSRKVFIKWKPPFLCFSVIHM